MGLPAVDEERPATYRELLGLVEYRAVFAASMLSWIGDYLCKAAVASLVFDRTGSALASAAAFAVGYLPWITAGPLLAAVAERYAPRSVMIPCDLARAALIALVAVPGIPVPALFVLLFASGLLAPPFEAARSAQLPQILPGDLYPLGLALNASTVQLAQVVGYAAGGMIAAYSQRTALLLNAATFLGSAFLLRRYVKYRPAALSVAQRVGLLRETCQGFAVVFGHPLMRAIAFIVFGAVTFVIVPEGLAAAWASELGGGGMIQGLIMAANPLGVGIGGLLLSRRLRLRTRTRLLRALAVSAPLSLVPALFSPPLAGVLIMVCASGLVMSLLLPTAQTVFKSVLPHEYRSRAFGVMSSGMQTAQGAAILATGALNEDFSTSIVIGTWCAVGTLLMLLVTYRMIIPYETLDSSRSAKVD